MSQDMRRATRDNAEFRVNMRPPRSDLSIDYHLRGGTFRLNTSNRDPLARGPFCEADDVRGLREEDEEENDTKKRSRDAPRFGSTGQSADWQARWHTYCMSETWIYLLVSLYVALSLKHDCVPAHPPPLLPSVCPRREWIKYFSPFSCIWTLFAASRADDSPLVTVVDAFARAFASRMIDAEIIAIVCTRDPSRDPSFSLIPGAREVIRSESQGITRRNATKYRRFREEAR